MIVREDGGRLAIVRQADHAYLSGRLAAAWGRPPWEPAEPFPSVAVAARQHDDAWLGYDEAPEVRDGRPLSFFEVDRVRTAAMYRAGISAVCQLDPYAGLLVSLHYSGFFTSHYGWEPLATPDRFPEPQRAALRALVDGEAERQRQLRQELHLGRAREVVLGVNYRWLQLWDRVSLDICRNSPVEPWAVDYPPVPVAYRGGERASLRLAMVAPGRYTLAPYPLLFPRFGAAVPVFTVDPGHPDRESFLRQWRVAESQSRRVSIEAA